MYQDFDFELGICSDIFVNENKIKTKIFRFLLTKTKTKIIFKTKKESNRILIT